MNLKLAFVVYNEKILPYPHGLLEHTNLIKNPIWKETTKINISMTNDSFQKEVTALFSHLKVMFLFFYRWNCVYTTFMQKSSRYITWMVIKKITVLFGINERSSSVRLPIPTLTMNVILKKILPSGASYSK